MRAPAIAGLSVGLFAGWAVAQEARPSARPAAADEAAEAAVRDEPLGKPALPTRITPAERERIRSKVMERLAGRGRQPTIEPGSAKAREITEAVRQAVRVLHGILDGMRASGALVPFGAGGAGKGVADAARGAVDEAARAAGNAAANAEINQARRGQPHPATGRGRKPVSTGQTATPLIR